MADPDALKTAAADALKLLDSYGPDDEQEDDEFVTVRARLRGALESEEGA